MVRWAGTDDGRREPVGGGGRQVGVVGFSIWVSVGGREKGRVAGFGWSCCAIGRSNSEKDLNTCTL